MKKFLICLLFLVLGYFLNGFVQNYIYEQSKQSYEDSLFPRIESLAPVGGFSCRPLFVYHSKSQFLLYCDGISSKESVARDELRKSVRNELEKWAIENKMEKRFLYVSYTDEIVHPNWK